ncbi:MAG TPA: DUF4142 domain-containing protein [Chitinophagaceae bacterium]
MKKLIIPFVVVFALACGNDESKDSVDMAKEENRATDSANMTVADSLGAYKNFLVEAASGGMMEVQLGEYASANAASSAVKQFGRMMVTDHSKGNTILTGIAQSKAIAIPNVPGEEHQKHIDELKKKKGAEFDKDYMDMMVEDHEEDIKKFEDASEHAKDQDIRKFAAEQVPILKKHLNAAKKVRDGLKN